MKKKHYFLSPCCFGEAQQLLLLRMVALLDKGRILRDSALAAYRGMVLDVVARLEAMGSLRAACAEEAALCRLAQDLVPWQD